MEVSKWVTCKKCVFAGLISLLGTLVGLAEAALEAPLRPQIEGSLPAQGVASC